MSDDLNALASLLSMPVVDPMTAPQWNFHVSLWSEPLSFLCTRCAAKDLSYRDMIAHLHTVHGEVPRPTPLAADIVRGGGVQFGLPRETLMEFATYRTEEVDGELRYVCLVCEKAGAEHHATDEMLFKQHLEHAHDGRFVEAPPEESPQAETPPQDMMPLPTSAEPASPPGASPQPGQDVPASEHHEG